MIVKLQVVERQQHRHMSTKTIVAVGVNSDQQRPTIDSRMKREEEKSGQGLQRYVALLRLCPSLLYRSTTN